MKIVFMVITLFCMIAAVIELFHHNTESATFWVALACFNRIGVMEQK